MAKKFMYVCLGILALIAMSHLGATSGQAADYCNSPGIFINPWCYGHTSCPSTASGAGCVGNCGEEVDRFFISLTIDGSTIAIDTIFVNVPGTLPGKGNLLEIVGAWFVADGGVQPGEVDLHYSELYEINNEAIFSFAGDPLNPGDRTATLGVALRSGEWGSLSWGSVNFCLLSAGGLWTFNGTSMEGCSDAAGVPAVINEQPSTLGAIKALYR